MKRIYKYAAGHSKGTPFLTETPLSGEIIHVGLQNNDVYVWAVVSEPFETQGPKKVLQWYGTGWDMPDSQEGLEYIGTVQQDGFVWHLFEVLPPK